MIKKLLFLLVVAVFIFTMGGIVGSLLTPVYTEPEVAVSPGVTITVTLPEPITDHALLAEMATRWMIQARGSHQRTADNWNVSTPWIIVEDQREWVRRYDIVIELLEKR